MSVDFAVIPVAGRGTRLLPATKSQPKEMLPVGRKPVVQYVIEELDHCGLKNMLLITGPGKTAIENHFDTNVELIDHLRETGKETLLRDLDFERPELSFFYTRQRRQLGLGHAVLCARPVLGGRSFVVALGDSIIGLNGGSNVVKTMIEQFESCQADAVIAFEQVPAAEVIHYGIAKPRGAAGDVFELQGLIEKPAMDAAPSNLAVAARYVFSPAIFELLAETQPGKNGEIQLTDAIHQLIVKGGKVLGVRLPPDQRRFDIGNFESYFEAFVEFALSDEQCGGLARQRVKELLGLND